MVLIQTEEPTLARVLAAARAHRRGPTPDQRERFAAWRISHLAGGHNGQIYRCDAFGAPICVKLCKLDDRRRAEREWIAMNLLARRLGSLVPCPLGYDPGSDAPAVTMTFLPGAPLANQDLSSDQLSGLAVTLRQLHRIGHADAPDVPWQRIGGARDETSGSILGRLMSWDDRWDVQVAAVAAYRSLRTSWLRSNDRAILSEPTAPIFSRGDANLANWLWDGDQVRCVDFEYAGWSDRAWDLADLIEGIWARPTPDAKWRDFVEQFGLSVGERRRFAAARRTLALLWVSLLWQRDAPPDQLWAQVKRARCLLSHTRGD